MPSLTEDANRGARAERLLTDDLLVDAFITLERTYIEAWRGTFVTDTDARERLWQAVQVVGKVRQHLVSVMNNGTLAQAEIDFTNRTVNARRQ